MHIERALYHYASIRGGVFFTSYSDMVSRTVSLTQHGHSALLELVTLDTRYPLAQQLRAVMQAELGKPYHLKVKPRGALLKGVGHALRQVDRRIGPSSGGKIALTRDYGAPELRGTHSIRTDNAPFTKQVMSNLELRNALAADNVCTLRVSPALQGTALHMIELWRPLEGVVGWEESAPKQDDPAQGEQMYQLFDEILQLTYTAVRAVTTWRMEP